MILQKPWSAYVYQLHKEGLCELHRNMLTNFMLAQQQNRGVDNRATLLIRLKLATEAQRDAAISVFDDFCKMKGI